jgi:hypothetical protein
MPKTEIPNLRIAATCMDCAHTRYVLSEHLTYCIKYECNVNQYAVCDSFSREVEHVTNRLHLEL